MSRSVTTQTWALIRRYSISQLRTPLWPLLRVLLWPALIIGLNYFVIMEFKDIGFPFETLPSIMIWIVTVSHFYHFANWLAIDREFGMKSLLISMGLRRRSYYLANSICVILTLLPILVSVIHMSIWYIFTESLASNLEIGLIFILFVIHFNAWIFVSSSILTSSRFAPLSLIVLFLQVFFHDAILWISVRVSDPLKVVVLFLASISPYESIAILCDSYTVCKHCDETRVSQDGKYVSQPVKLILIAMVVWSLIAHLFARWFEEVCPWQEDADIKSPLFCLEGLLFNRSSSRSSSKLEPETKRNIKFFEQSISEREKGIEINRLSKSFNDVEVVNDLSLNIYRGETTLLLGHNGAGKTTLMNIILGRLSPDKGRVIFKSSIFGKKRTSVGVCPQTSILDKYLNVRQHLELIIDIKNCDMAGYQKYAHIMATIEDVSLSQHVNKLPDQLSGGMKRKLSLAMAFVGNSTILILDEPSSGLDPDSRVFIWNAIRKYRADRTVLLSTQHMEEADYLGDRIAIMREGRIVCCGSSTFLTHIFGSGYKLRIECSPNRKDEILTLIRQYFKYAKTNNEDTKVIQAANKSTSVDIVVELGDGGSPEVEAKMINLLEKIESQSQSLGIKSHGLKSSSLEDVLMRTSDEELKANGAQDGDEIKTPAQVSLKMITNSTTDHIKNLTMPKVSKSSTKLSNLLSALLMKHINIYKRDWISLLIYRIAVPALMLLLLIHRWNTELLLTNEFYPHLLISLIVMHYIYYPTSERVSKFKAMQLTSDANFLLYWIAQFIADIPSALIGVLIVNLMLRLAAKIIFLQPIYQVHLILSAAMFMLHISSSIFSYVISTMFKEASVGYFCMLLASSWFINRVLLLFRLAVKRDLSFINNILLRVFTAILPTDAYQYIVHGLSADCYVKPETTNKCVVRSDLTISPIIFGFSALFGQAIVYSLLLYIVESNNLDLWYYLNPKNYLKTPISIAQEFQEIDQDVQDEMCKAMNLIKNVSTNTHSLVAADLKKSYVRGKPVINDLSFTVNRGECFGLLGVNGAGKSTTFSIIAAEIGLDSGRIWLNGHYITDNINTYRSKLGYGPQSNPDMSLSPYEALSLMARLRRVDVGDIPSLVNSALEVLDMSEHSHKTVKSLSGGTKRKLALGMAFIGNPSLLALDEPTAGVDPIARRGIWQLLKSLRSHGGVSVVISSHAMEECEAICDRVAIMARGRLRCIGSFLHLRSKFPQGCNIKVQFSQASANETLNESYLTINEIILELKSNLESVLGAAVRLVDTNINSATFNISDDHVKRSTLFKILMQAREKHANLSYMINDSSLQDIFIALAREQQELR